MDLAHNATPLWLSHHWPEEHDRCARVGSKLVCRRCAVLYPTIVVSAMLTLVLDPPLGLAVTAMWLLPLPMSIEWIAEKTFGVGHSPRRLVALAALGAVGIGTALATHVAHPFHPDALAPMATHVTLCAVSSIVAARRGSRKRVELTVSRPAWEREHDLREARRSLELRRLLSESDRGSLTTE